MANHLVQAVLSLGLSIVVILCVVALVARNNFMDDDEMMNTKAVYTICKPCEYKDACKASLKEVALNSSSTKKDYIFATFYSTQKELQKAIEKAGSLKKDYSDKSASSDLQNCEKLLGHAVQDLNQVLHFATKSKIATLGEQADPILIWLTAVRAYQTTCVEEIQDGDLKKEMKKALEEANKHTFNTEKITNSVADILLEFGVDLGHFHFHRRLLEEEEEGDSPSWYSASDRALLGDDKDDEEDEDDHKGHGIFKKHTSEDYFKTPQPEKIKKGSVVEPDVVVSKDDKGDYTTIKKALDAYPSNHKGRYVIYVRAGVYDEGQIIVNKNQCNVYMYGDGRDKTVITGDISKGSEQVGASQTATFIAEGERFVAKSIGFKNTNKNGDQGVAFQSQAPHSIMVDCKFEGNQNVVYYLAHDQFYKNCSLTGTGELITGSGRAFFQDCEIYVKKPEKDENCYITADRRMKYEEAGGVVIQRSKINGTKELLAAKGEVKSYLGRPLKAKATAMVMQCKLGGFIEPEGWSKNEESSDGKKYHKTCMFREYSNKGPGSNPDDRVKWKGFKNLKDKKYAGKFTPKKFMDAKCWLPNAGVPVEAGFKS